ncbi:peroxiredoxin family protein [Psychroserpens damuponensis]|uniref:peroxiredoxin family protein n=1 Tax=Psychroserpens damuponensis TaxID=943936 RepID=UPI00058F7078|nr:hypothetical protein [Psychroserpens damuponensis]
MKYILAILILVLTSQVQAQDLNQKSVSIPSSNDTLVLKTKKQKGVGVFELGSGSPNFEKFNQASNLFIPPKNIDSLSFSKIIPDYKEKETNFFYIIKGVLNGKEVFVIDQNNNKDFNDDIIRPIKEFKWKSSENLVQINYNISNGEKLVRDSTYIGFGYAFGRLLFGKREYLLAEVELENQKFEIGIIDYANSAFFTYRISTEIIILSRNELKVDSLLKRNSIKMGEFIKLNGNYYRFHSISNNGDYLTLIREYDFESKIGTQIGMLAPEFEAISMSNDMVKSSDYIKKPLIIVNSCGCGGDVKSTEAYFEIKEFYNNKVDVIRLDSAIKKNSKGVHIDVMKEQNKSIYDAYRGVFCSRMSYVIGKDNRIIDKFEVTDWNKFLPKLKL